MYIQPIQPISQTQMTINSAGSKTPKNSVRKNSMNQCILVTSGLGIAAVATGLAGIAKKGNFSKSIEKLGLELKDNILQNKLTGEKFTGKIKSYVGKLGFNKIETREYKDGIMQECTLKDIFSRELEGTFMKDGKLCMRVQVDNYLLCPWKKNIACYKYSEDRSSIFHIDAGNVKQSAFDWARKYIEEHGFNNPF